MPTDAELEQVVNDSLTRYWAALELADGVRRAWVEAGSVLTVVWSNGIESEAPLLKLLRECERDCERFARAIPRPKGVGGRPGEADHQRRLGESPATLLRDQLIASLPDRADLEEPRSGSLQRRSVADEHNPFAVFARRVSGGVCCPPSQKNVAVWPIGRGEFPPTSRWPEKESMTLSGLSVAASAGADAAATVSVAMWVAAAESAGCLRLCDKTASVSMRVYRRLGNQSLEGIAAVGQRGAPYVATRRLSRVRKDPPPCTRAGPNGSLFLFHVSIARGEVFAS
jgi:hypothetical protein